MILGKKSTSRQSVLERGRDSMENLSLSLTSLSSSPQRSATQPSSHLLMQKRTIEIKLVSFLVDQGLLIVLFVSVRAFNQEKSFLRISIASFLLDMVKVEIQKN